MTIYKQIVHSMLNEYNPYGDEIGSLQGKIILKKPEIKPDKELQTKLNTLSNKYSDNLLTYAIAYDAYIELDKIMAKKDAPLGTGSAYMKDLCAIADEHNKIIVLQTAPTGYNKEKGSDYFRQFKITSASDRLKRFYNKFGFVDSYPKKDIRTHFPGNMYRLPK